jgi:hypothetical protein
MRPSVRSPDRPEQIRLITQRTNKTKPPPRGANSRQSISTTISVAAVTRSFFRPIVSAKAPEGTSNKKIVVAQIRLSRTN